MASVWRSASTLFRILKPRTAIRVRPPLTVLAVISRANSHQMIAEQFTSNQQDDRAEDGKVGESKWRTGTAIGKTAAMLYPWLSRDQ